MGTILSISALCSVAALATSTVVLLHRSRGFQEPGPQLVAEPATPSNHRGDFSQQANDVTLHLRASIAPQSVSDIGAHKQADLPRRSSPRLSTRTTLVHVSSDFPGSISEENTAAREEPHFTRQTRLQLLDLTDYSNQVSSAAPSQLSHRRSPLHQPGARQRSRH